jgi:hypothetical protein
MNGALHGHLRLVFDRDPITAFSPLLQNGFSVEITSGNLLDLLCRTCGLEPQEVRAQIQTLFLNGKPVDDMAHTHVRDNDCLALSSAMPGLVGATMRSGGILAGFRKSISHRSSAAQADDSGGVISIKLFNLLIHDIGPRFLEHGILVRPTDLEDLLARLSKQDRTLCRQAQWNGQLVSADALLAMNWPQEPGFIRLQTAGGWSAAPSV